MDKPTMRRTKEKRVAAVVTKSSRFSDGEESEATSAPLPNLREDSEFRASQSTAEQGSPNKGSSIKERASRVRQKDNPAEQLDEHEDEDDPESFANSESSRESSSGEEFFMDEEELSEPEAETSKETKTKSKQRLNYICEKCGLEMSKPALLAQHMLSHSDQSAISQGHVDADIQALQHRISSELRS